MALNKVEICGVNTAKLPILNQDEKDALWERITAGDATARELYIKGNLRLVLSVIKRFSGSSENADDLFQIGCIGLMKAIDNFDNTLGVKFSTYAVPMIAGEIRRYLQYPGQPFLTGYGLQGYLRQGKSDPPVCQGTMLKRNRHGNRHSGRGNRLCPGRYPEPGQPL